jgi:thymidylate synthase
MKQYRYGNGVSALNIQFGWGKQEIRTAFQRNRTVWKEKQLEKYSEGIGHDEIRTVFIAQVRVSKRSVYGAEPSIYINRETVA